MLRRSAVLRRKPQGFAPLPPGRQGFRLFCDLDGVLADFAAGAKKLGVDDIGRDPTAGWKALEAHPDFFGTLDWMHGAEGLWSAIQPHQPIILTGMPRGVWAEPQKRRWVSTHLGTGTTVITCMRVQKAQLAHPACVLIDDDAETCERWAAAGGHAVHHTSAAASIDAVEAYIEGKEYLEYRTGGGARTTSTGLQY